MQKQHIPLILQYIVLVLGLMALLCLPAKSQPKQYDFSTIRLNGLDINGKYTREQLVAAFGEPDETSQAIHDCFVYNRRQSTIIAKSSIGFQESGRENYDVEPSIIAIDEIGYNINNNGYYELSVFFIESDEIILNDYIKVGDSISKVGDMGGITLDGEYEDGSKYKYWCPAGAYDPSRIDWTLCPRFDYDTTGKIKRIELYYD